MAFVSTVLTLSSLFTVTAAIGCDCETNCSEECMWRNTSGFIVQEAQEIMDSATFAKFSNRSRTAEALTVFENGTSNINMTGSIFQRATEMLWSQPHGSVLGNRLISRVSALMVKQRAKFGLPPLQDEGQKGSCLCRRGYCRRAAVVCSIWCVLSIAFAPVVGCIPCLIREGYKECCGCFLSCDACSEDVGNNIVM
mmetsp:Transcript_150531/g.273987  ORF Transcript_150531/g.273987 Transcript_150531/m.273987 type:complete len:196 (-) Transcript_150531:38-625(-)